jgi:hypothetical protein
VQNHTSPVGRIIYPSLNEPKENLSKNMEWGLGLEVDITEAESVMQLIEEQMTEFREKNPQFPKTNEFRNKLNKPDALNFPYKPSLKNEPDGTMVPIEGKIVFNFKRPLLSRNGKQNQAPVILSSKGQPVANPPEITTGSVGRAIFRPFVYDNASKGVGFYLLGVQIKALSSVVIEAEPIEGGWDPEDEAAAPALTLDGEDLPF